MNRALTSVAVMAVGLLWASHVQAQTADDVVEKHLAAMGGRAALAKLTSQVATGTVSMSAQGADISGPVEIYRKAPNKQRTLITFDMTPFGGSEMIVDQRCDGKTAFLSNSMQGDREITGAQLQGMLNASFPSPLLTYKDAGAKVELVGKDKVGNRAVFVLQYTPKAGPSSRSYFDAETYLVLRTVAKVDIPEAGGEIEQTNEFADYRVVDGVKSPFTITMINPSQTLTISLAKVDYNKPIDDVMFARPVVK